MNKLKLIFILLFISVTAFIVGGIILVQSGGFSNEKIVINQEQTADLDGINEISIQSLSNDIKLIPVDDHEIRVHLHGDFLCIVCNHNIDLTVEKNGTEITVTTGSSSYGFIVFNNAQLDVYIPRSYHKEITLQTSSGDITVHDMQFEKINVFTLSGNIDLRRTSGFIHADSKSGDIRIDLTTEEFNMTIFTLSGDVRLTLPKVVMFKFELQTTSGKINIDYSHTTIEDSKRKLVGYIGESNSQINIRTTSGDIRIRKP